MILYPWLKEVIPQPIRSLIMFKNWTTLENDTSPMVQKMNGSTSRLTARDQKTNIRENETLLVVQKMVSSTRRLIAPGRKNQ